MRVMVTLAPDDLGQLRQQVAALEEAGVDAVGIGDSPRYHDPYVALTVAAEATRHVALGPMVTNLITRHPRVTARALLSLDELAPGRVLVGLGSGDSALADTGARPATLSVMREGIGAMRDGLARATARGPRSSSRRTAHAPSSSAGHSRMPWCREQAWSRAPNDVAKRILRLADHGVVIPAIGLDVEALVHHLGADVVPEMRSRHDA